ncbi:MAG: GDP-mannose 4,6-dehydratase [Candidatus Omnitrophota bacterium]
MKNYWKNRKVLVTGHEGFLGSWLVKTLLERKAIVVGLDKIAGRPIIVLNGLRNSISSVKADVAQLGSMKKIFLAYRPEVVFHLAAEAIVDKAKENARLTFKSNIEGTWNILEAALECGGVKSIVIASSDKAYGSHPHLPYAEDYPLMGRNPYDVSKSCADLIAYSYWHTYKLPVAVTRCGNIYGPGEYNFSRIVPDTIRSILKQKTLLIRSDGTFTRDYVHVRDIVAGYMLLAEKMKPLKLGGEAFNFSCERPMSVIEVVEKLCRLTDKKLKYKILNRAKYEIQHQFLSSKKARKVLGWKPQHSIENGFLDTYQWYKEFFSIGKLI